LITTNQPAGRMQQIEVTTAIFLREWFLDSQWTMVQDLRDNGLVLAQDQINIEFGAPLPSTFDLFW